MKELMFQNQTIRLIDKDGKKWASAADIARALGYARADKVTRIYDRHKAEFSASMTQIVETPTLGASGNLVTQTRVFSLRGAHLIGMFARTSRAQEFRRWVLDILEGHQAAQSLIQEWFEAKSALDAQDRFASLCGQGLSEHKRRKPPLVTRVNQISEQMQPSLQLN
ncbi:BRO family protein [Alcaligenes nematophilus]|uniref:BRO family protein n=1 Tax=Alcaligenes nematophilus TaxID=2994643 RepID=A0ABU3MTS2_9BURK|nr:BRO family protein [Alcaligenes nematophilus]MDT8505169.1 BRO family protein [Alcaligenes nematophilus]